jgi:transcriptional regulator GlxA family with amidase domain
MDIAVLLYDRFTALDAVGPYEVLSRLPGARLRFVADEPGPVRTDTGALAITADAALADVPAPDVLVVPGGPGDVVGRAGGDALEWIRAAHERSTWTTSVCTGSLILGAAGVLAGRRATSHWAALERLGELGAEPVRERVVTDGKVMTGAGVSAGIDMALTLAGRIAGDEVAQGIQVWIEYDPEPPYDAGAPEKVAPHVLEALQDRRREMAAASAARAG